MENFKYKTAENRTTNLIEKVKTHINQIDDENLIPSIKEFRHRLIESQNKINLEIALIGQYNAGKSSIASALTGDRTIKIGQDITTDVPKKYPYGNSFIVDTPGIYAGRPDHDEVSIEYMDRADLLVYVISSQGFSDLIGDNFKKIAFQENRIDKMMLVINKSSQGNKESSLDYWKSDALKVTEPKTEDDLYLSIIDAQDYIEALTIEDENDRDELIIYSNFNEFIEKLNKFISDKGILGRLITPLNLIQTFLNKTINDQTAGNEDTRNLLELLNRRRFRLTESEKNITNVVNGHIDTVVSEIKRQGDKIANLIEKDGDKEILQSESENSMEYIKEITDDANKKIEASIESEFTQLQNELDILMQSELAQTLINQESIKISFNTDIEINGADRTRVDSGIDILNNISRFAEGFAVNSKAGKLGLEGLRKASGSEAHKVIYNVGKFFGHNFKPYEAVKYADKVAKVGSVVGKVATALPFLVAGYEEYAEKKYAEKIKIERQKVRKSYDDIANDIKSSFKKQFDEFVRNTYTSEIKNTDKIIKGIRDSDKLNKKEVLDLQELLTESNEILKRIK